MKKTLLTTSVLCLTLISFFANAQETRVNELGLSMTSFDNFGLSYKVGKNNKYWRFGAFDLNYSRSDMDQQNADQDVTNQRFSVRVGREIRKDIAEKVQVKYGADLLFGYTKTERNFLDTETFTEQFFPGVGLTFGFNYFVSEKVMLSLEINPSLRYSITESRRFNPDFDVEPVESKTKGLNANLSNQTANLTLAYRFGKKDKQL